MSNAHLTLVWFRDDLRVDDHEALTAARAEGQVIGLWIRESRSDDGPGPRLLGGAARWWAHESLRVLETELAQLGIPLLFAAGSAADIVPQAAADLEVDAVRWSRRYAPASRDLDAQIKTDLADAGREVHSHTGALLVEPWTISPQGGDFYKVFTPYFNAVRDRSVGDVLPAPRRQTSLSKADRQTLDGTRGCATSTASASSTEPTRARANSPRRGPRSGGRRPWPSTGAPGVERQPTRWRT